jgi:hypothetical protein
MDEKNIEINEEKEENQPEVIPWSGKFHLIK